jgi:hypothetical protein
MGILDAMIDLKIIAAATTFTRLVREQLDQAGTDKTVRGQIAVVFDNALARYAEVSADQPTVQRVIPRIRVEVRRCLTA